MRSWDYRVLATVLSCWTVGCATGVDIGNGSFSGVSVGASWTDTDTGTMGDGMFEPQTCAVDADCSISDDLCFVSQGVCVDGICEFAPKAAGAACDDANPCTEDDVCDGLGECRGQPIECSAPNASGGQCSNGVCGELSCDMGWGNCNGDWSDGCETRLDSVQDCGSCGELCTAGPNALAECNGGVCERSCMEPWENCDGDWDNGCEIPTGVPNQCDANGLNAETGCWTAYCGSSNTSTAKNFGTWYCSGCSTCNVPSGGMCQWCSPTAGVWYPPDSCVCGAWEHLVCAP